MIPKYPQWLFHTLQVFHSRPPLRFLGISWMIMYISWESHILVMNCKKNHDWLVVWLPFFIFPYIGLLIIPTDFHIFQRGSNHQPYEVRIQVMQVGATVVHPFHGSLTSGPFPFPLHASRSWQSRWVAVSSPPMPRWCWQLAAFLHDGNFHLFRGVSWCFTTLTTLWMVFGSIFGSCSN